MNAKSCFCCLWLLLLTACITPRLDVEVQAFNQWDNGLPWTGENFTVTPAVDNLEQKYYGGILSVYLETQGVRIAPAGRADYKIITDFHSEKQLYPYNQPVYGDSGFWVNGGYYKTNNRIYYQRPYWVSTGIQITDYNTGVDIIYNHMLNINITDTAGKKVFEAKAILASYKNDMNRYAPYLIASVFRDFPGTNGVVRRYRYDPRLPAAAATAVPAVK